MIKREQLNVLECERKKEREIETEVERGGGWGLYTIGLDMNAPRHSFPHIPFNFNSLMELATLHTHSHCAQRNCMDTHMQDNRSTHE